MRRGSAAQWVAIIVLLVIIAIAIWFFVFDRSGPRGPSPAVLNPPASASSAPQHPISQANVPAAGSSAGLADLHNSDAMVMQSLLALPGAQGLQDLLVQQAIIPNIVATVDALPRQSFGSRRILPLRTPQGAFAPEQSNGQTVIGNQNNQRYAPYMQVIESVDTRALVAWYVHDYPLFQQAYRELGYPKAYFNDRLVAVIDNLLATPEPTQPIEVKKSGAFYVYVDSRLESLGAGQKMLLHTGPDNEAKIKVKLREMRAMLVGQALQAGNLVSAPASNVSAPAPAGTH